jgi:hypothetical protein
MTRFQFRRLALTGVAAALLAGCSALLPVDDKSHLLTFTTQMRGGNQVPPVATSGNGQVDAMLNTQTKVLRWRLTYTSLSGPPRAGHFHGPAAIGVNAGVALPFSGLVSSPMDGSATLTAAQVADLTAGRWYANIHTVAIRPDSCFWGRNLTMSGYLKVL